MRYLFLILLCCGQYLFASLPEAFRRSDNPAWRGDYYHEERMFLFGGGFDTDEERLDFLGRYETFTPRQTGIEEGIGIEVAYRRRGDADNLALFYGERRSNRESGGILWGSEAGITVDPLAVKGGIVIHPGIIVKPDGNQQWRFHTRFSCQLDGFDEGPVVGDAENLARLDYLFTFSRFFQAGCTAQSDLAFGIVTRNLIGGTVLETGLDFYVNPDLRETARLSVSLSFDGESSGSTFTQKATTLKDPGALRLWSTIRYSRIGTEFTPPLVYYTPPIPAMRSLWKQKGLATQLEIVDISPSEIEFCVMPGDNLMKISRNLPQQVLKQYHGNVRAIADYNKIKDTSKLLVGQTLKLPVQQARADSIEIEPADRLEIEQLVNSTLTTAWIEGAVNRALWKYALYDFVALKHNLPNKGGADNVYWLNARAIADIHDQNYDQAIRHLSWAIELSPDSSVLHANLGRAYYLLGDLEGAENELVLSLELGNDTPETLKLLEQVRQEAENEE